MKRNFISKSLIAKVALVLVIILLFQFTFSKPAEAASLGGTLLNPIVNLFVYLADGVLQILQSGLTKIDQTFTYIDLSADKWSWPLIIAKVVNTVGPFLVLGAALSAAGIIGLPAIVAAILPSVSTGIAITIASGIYVATYPRFGKKLEAVVFGESFVYSNIYITPETILKNQIKLFDVNFFESSGNTVIDAVKALAGIKQDDSPDNTVSLADTLRNIVSQVYTTIRDVALVAMLIVIIYVAIRLLLALTPKEKSRYKESIINCVIGMLLIVLMHFIMSLSVKGFEMITNSIIVSNQVITELPENASDDQIASYLNANPDVYNSTVSGVSLEIVGDKLYDAVDSGGSSRYPGIVLGQDEEGKKTSYVKASNFTEQARYMAQKLYELDSDNNTIENWEHIGWALVYIMLVILTLAFVILYAKRTLYMAVLTIFAPVVGVMYPINRVNGSRAHTLNFWFREYMANLIIQPVHIFLYTVFVGSVMAMALNNPIWAIAAISGLIVVEHLLMNLLGIQDSMIGGLGKAIQDTTRAIKTTEKATTSIARSVGRTISRGANAAGNLAIAGASMIGARNAGNDSNEEENNTQPRVHPVLGIADQNANSGVNDNDTSQEVDEVAGLPNYANEEAMAGTGDQYLLPYTDEANENSSILDGKEYQGNNGINDDSIRQVDEEATLQNYINEGFGTNADGEYFNPYTDEYDPNYNPLNDKEFQAYTEGGSGIGIDQSTLDMVDNLNKSDFSVLSGGLDTNEGYEDVIRADGDRNVYMNDRGDLRIEPSDGGNYRDPMAMAMGADMMSNINVNADSSSVIRNNDNNDNLVSAGPSTQRSSSTSSIGTGSSSIALGESGGSQSIPDGNNVRISNDNGINETTDSSGRKSEFTVLDGGRSGGRSSTTTDNSENIHRLTPDEYEVIPPHRQRTNNRRSSTNTDNTENIHKLTPDEYEELPPQREKKKSSTKSRKKTVTLGPDEYREIPVEEKRKTSSNTSNSGNNSRKANTKDNNNTGNANNSNNNGTNTNNTSNPQQNNNGNGTNTNNRAKEKVIEVNDGVARTAGRVAEKATGAVGAIAEGVLDVATNLVSGNVSGAAESAVGGVTKAVTGVAPTRSGGTSRASNTEGGASSTVGRPNQNVQYIVQEAGMSLDEARALESQCKDYRITDSKNMALVGQVYKKASAAEKKEVIKLSSMLYEMKRNGRSREDARKELERVGKVSPSTRDALMKMYEKLVG